MSNENTPENQQPAQLTVAPTTELGVQPEGLHTTVDRPVQAPVQTQQEQPVQAPPVQQEQPIPVPTQAPVQAQQDEPIVLTEDQADELSKRTHDYTMVGSYTKQTKLEADSLRLNLPSDLKENILDTLNSIDTDDFDGGDKSWNASHIGAYYNGIMNGMWDNRLTKGKWTQKIKTEDKTIELKSLRTSAGKTKVIKGKEAMYRLMDSLGTGRVGEVPLVHTGIWVKFTPPKEESITDYYRGISKEKAKLGRFTYGKVFSNMKIIHDDLTMRFILKHVISTSADVAPTDIEGLMNLIAIEDTLTLQWGLANAMYPEGVEYDVACGVDPTKCNFLYEGVLDVGKLHFMDEQNIPKECIDTLRLTGSGVVTEEDIKVYKKNLWETEKAVYDVNTLSGVPLKVKLKHSVLSDQIKIGKKWIESCRSDVHKALDVTAEDDERDNFINSRAKISFLRQYQHYVEHIDTGSGLIESDDLSQALTDISASDISRESLLDAIEAFINNSQYSIVGIPKFECPKCKKEPDSPESVMEQSNIKTIIPLDVVQVFFTLIGIKMFKITDRVL